MISVSGHFLKVQRVRINDWGTVTITNMDGLTEYNSVDAFGNPKNMPDDIFKLVRLLFG